MSFFLFILILQADHSIPVHIFCLSSVSQGQSMQYSDSRVRVIIFLQLAYMETEPLDTPIRTSGRHNWKNPILLLNSHNQHNQPGPEEKSWRGTE